MKKITIEDIRKEYSEIGYAPPDTPLPVHINFNCIEIKENK